MNHNIANEVKRQGTPEACPSWIVRSKVKTVATQELHFFATSAVAFFVPKWEERRNILDLAALDSICPHRIDSAQDGGCGGCCQWVLAAACEAVERPSQPLGFESLALRTVTRYYR